MALLQAIVYSKATGRVRRVLDPETDTNEATLGAHIRANLHPGEAVILREKLPALADGTGQNRLHEWQAAACQECGNVPRDLHPSIRDHIAANVTRALTVVEDLHQVVHDATQAIIGEIHCDPACGDGYEGHTLRRL